MMTDPATVIKREVLQLVELQIETLRREGAWPIAISDGIVRVPGKSPAFTRNSIGLGEDVSTGNLIAPLRLAVH